MAVASATVALPFQAFSSEQRALLEAVCEQMLPSDDLPGAKEAGVVQYIERQLAGTLRQYDAAYRSALAELRDAGFLAMPFDDRTRFLEQVEAGKVKGIPASFIRMLADHTMQGFFGDPKHGGNRDRIGWKMIGIEKGHSH
jgi:gluconate 2-dehydrogenase gamma chain